MTLPDSFCWTRFGTEAAEPIEHIILRKEEERLANGGVFVWGIGNAVGPSIRELLDQPSEPEVMFSPMRSSPKETDVHPDAVAVWVCGQALDGSTHKIPQYSLVTSRYSESSPKATHYALVCRSLEPLLPLRSENFLSLRNLRNLRTGRVVGASQVTAVVSRDLECGEGGPLYLIAIRAQLVYPYFLRLRHPHIAQSGDHPARWSINERVALRSSLIGQMERERTPLF